MKSNEMDIKVKELQRLMKLLAHEDDIKRAITLK